MSANSSTRPARPVPWDEINERRRDRDAKAPGVPRDVGAGNTSGWDRHRLDIARAKTLIGDPEKATELMHAIRVEHPSWLRYQQYGRDITREILQSRPRMPSEEMLHLADFMGVEA